MEERSQKGWTNLSKRFKMTLAPDAIFRTVLKGIPSTKGKRDGKPVPNHTPFKSLRNNVSSFLLL